MVVAAGVVVAADGGVAAVVAAADGGVVDVADIMVLGSTSGSANPQLTFHKNTPAVTLSRRGGRGNVLRPDVLIPLMAMNGR